MIFHDTDISLEKGQTLYVIPFSDIQSEEEYPRLEALVKWLVERKKKEGAKVLMFGGGDYFESPSPSDRAVLKAAKRGFGIYEEMARDIERIYAKRTEEIAEILMPLKGSIGGLLRGHHWVEFGTPDFKQLGDTNRYLASMLEAEYWGSTVYWTLRINNLPFTIFASHGYGSGRTPGARVTKRIRMREVQLAANWYAMGHDDEKFVYPTEALIGREYIKQYFTGMGSFQRSYNFDRTEGTYAEDLLLPPAALGVLMARVKIQETENGPRLDYHVSA